MNSVLASRKSQGKSKMALIWLVEYARVCHHGDYGSRDSTLFEGVNRALTSSTMTQFSENPSIGGKHA